MLLHDKLHAVAERTVIVQVERILGSRAAVHGDGRRDLTATPPATRASEWAERAGRARHCVCVRV